MITSSPLSSRAYQPKPTTVYRYPKAVNQAGQMSADRVVGWLARTYRLTHPDGAGRTIDAFLLRTATPLSKSEVSKLENGKGKWSPALMALMERSLNLNDKPLQRIYLTLGGSCKALGLEPQTAADNLDEIIDGNIEQISPLDVVQTIQWLTSRKDPLGRRSWEAVIANYVDCACDTKGIYSNECDQALSSIAIHPAAKHHYYDYMQELCGQRGHPKAFVPVAALQARGAYVNPVSLVGQIRQPDNRWLIREHLNLASAKLFDPSVPWSDRQIAYLDRAAHEWSIDSGSEVAVKRAATELMNCILLRQRGEVRLPLTQLAPVPATGDVRAFVIAQKIMAMTGIGTNDQSVLNVLATLIDAAVCSGVDAYRSMATCVLSASPFASSMRDYARLILDGKVEFPIDRSELSSWIRILGKFGDDVSDADSLWKYFVMPTDYSLLETCGWALCDIAAVAFPSENDDRLRAVPYKLQSIANGTVSRALISAYGRAAKWTTMRGITQLSGEPLAELRWWFRYRAPGEHGLEPRRSSPYLS